MMLRHTGRLPAKPLLALLMGLSLVACSQEHGHPKVTSSDGIQTGGTLTYLEQQAHTNLYPPAGGFYPNGGILEQITDKLTWQDPATLQIKPWIAQSWTTNKNKTEYTFKLRPGVTFSDGTPLDAKAVARNFDTYGHGNPKLHLPASEVVNNYDHSEVIDAHTIKFYFTRPSPGFLQATSTIGAGLVSPSTLDKPFEQLGDARNIIGSGPFVVSHEQLGRELDLVARKDYAWAPQGMPHQGRAYLDGIHYIVTPEDGVRIGALLSGQADVMRQLQAYDEKRVTQQGFKVYAEPTRGVNDGLSLRPENPVMRDIRVREALLHATNTQEIVKTLFSPNYPAATSVIAQTAAGYVNLSDKLSFDPQLSQRLLAEAGWTPDSDGILAKDGRRLEMTAYVAPPQPQNKQVLQLIAQQWRKVGILLHIRPGDSGSRTLDNLNPYKTAFRVSEVGRADPDVIKSMFYPANRDSLLQKGGKSSQTKTFRDDTLNQLLLAIAEEPDTHKRLALTADAQRYLIAHAYVIPIFEEPQVFAGAPWVHGMGFEAVGRPWFYNTWLASH